MDLSQFRQLSLACSDDPFFEKPQNEHKYFPRVVFIDSEGKQVGQCTSDSTFPAAEFVSYCRDNKLKMNDDRKVVIRMSGLNDVQMVLLFVTGKQIKGGDYS